MTPSPPLHLHKLTLLKEIFSLLNSGKHLNRVAEPKLWAELEKEQDSYQALFAALGYDLRLDGRGFGWFQADEANREVSKTTRQLALLFMLVFEFQADAGLHLGRFTEWPVDVALLNGLVEKNRLLLEAEGLANAELLGQMLNRASNYGFATAEGNQWRLLPAVFRYLDRFEELVKSPEPDTEEPGEPEE